MSVRVWWSPQVGQDVDKKHAGGGQHVQQEITFLKKDTSLVNFFFFLHDKKSNLNLSMAFQGVSNKLVDSDGYVDGDGEEAVEAGEAAGDAADCINGPG